MDTATMSQHFETLEEDGYCILENVIEEDLIKEVRESVARLETELDVQPRGNRAEGYATKRMYNLLAKDRAFWKLPIHENVLPFPEYLLDDECILSGTTCMNIGPGEVHQGLHSDDGLVSVKRPRIPFMVTTIWAFTDFTDENGATRIVPGSHKFDHEPRKGQQIEHIPAEMKAGSVLVVNGGTWHCGGANTSEDEWRLGVSVQYCQGYLRQQQNQYYSLAPNDVRAMPQRLAALCGFSLYKGIMGHVDGASPGRFLGASDVDEIAYAAMRTTNGVAES
ncbi:MAG: phytanoyl-CoA dioxygenase family protein [Actinomycetota bacterium]|mgnify:FL=1|jgi:ectoine hydroxylase-related dioxygenase (phytanoyl-CoA dioxygenase family)|nr:phytanoyl-CoA dioxygenase family protein [Actinomycetota bacterium]